MASTSHNNKNKLVVQEPTQAQRNMKFTFPRSLERPEFRAINPAAISAVSPNFEGFSAEHFIQKIRLVSPILLTAIAKTTIHSPKGLERPPHDLNVIVDEINCYTPTHLLAVSSTRAPKMQDIILHPAHSFVIAANCARIPPLPHSKAMTPDNLGRTVNLPLVQLFLPNTTTFPLLLDYLYRQNTDLLLTSLLSFPFPSSATLHNPEHLARKMAASTTGSALLAQARRVHGLWRNVVALGVFDKNLWQVMDTAWEILLGAMALKFGEPWSWKKSA